jgi:hypothetical protein
MAAYFDHSDLPPSFIGKKRTYCFLGPRSAYRGVSS